MDHTVRLELPYIMPSQAQKHVTHNEALEILDGIVHLHVISRSLALPPALPAEGNRYIIPADAGGEWAPHAGEIARRILNGWSYSMPKEGWVAWCAEEAALLVHASGAWAKTIAVNGQIEAQTVGIGTLPDPANPLSVTAASSLFSHSGAGHRIAVNRAATADTASVVFQQAFSGRAETGLAGDDGFSVKVSPDGNIWKKAISVDLETGAAAFPFTSLLAGAWHKSYTAPFETSSLSYVAVPGFSLTVTPRSALSRFLVLLSVAGHHKDNFSGAVRLMRNAQEILSGSPTAFSGGSACFLDLGGSQNWTIRNHVNFGIDAPETDAEITYSIQVRTGSALEPVYINKNHQNTSAQNFLVLPSSNLVVIEIT